MEDAWEEANSAYHAGARERATQHLLNALRNATRTSQLHRTILQINLHAISTYTKTAAPPPLPTTTSNTPSIRLIAEEAFLTATYNATLRALRDHSKVSLDQLRAAITRIPHVLHFLTNASCPVEHTPQAINLSIERLMEAPIPQLQKPQIRTWADAAASCYELLTAALLLQNRPTTQHAPVSKSFRRLIDLLSTSESCEITQQYDQRTFRSDYLQTLSTSQLTHIANIHMEAPDEDLHLPLAYLTAIKSIHFRHPSARRLLQVCAARSYRLADCLSLLARLEKGEQALQAWQRAFAVDVRRPAGLWLAAREFSRVGKYAQQARILACLEQLLDSDIHYDGVRIDNCFIDDMHDINVDNVVTKPAVMAERVRALVGAGEWADLRKLLDQLKDDIYARADILRDRALCAVCEGDVREGLSLAEVAKAASAGPTDTAGALLVQAEASLRMEDVEKARERVMEAFREAKLGLVGMSWEAEPPRLLRGVCFHNLAVLHYCVNENVAADECFAAAETAFRKCEEECREVAARLGVLSAYGRCLAMWGRGMKEDAAEYWRVVRGLSLQAMDDEKEDALNGDDDIRPDSHVVCDVREEILELFDRICLNLCREVEKRKEMERMMAEVEKEWPLGQKRRRNA